MQRNVPRFRAQSWVKTSLLSSENHPQNVPLYTKNAWATYRIPSFIPDFAIDLQIEEDEGEEGHDARDDDVVPPPGEFHVLLVLKDLRHFVIDGVAAVVVVLAARDQVVLEEAGKVLRLPTGSLI